MKEKPYKRESGKEPRCRQSPVLLVAASRSSSSSQCLTVVGFQAGNQRSYRSWTRYDDHIRSRGRLVTPEDLSNQSLSSISLHRAAKLSRRRNAQSSHR